MARAAMGGSGRASYAYPDGYNNRGGANRDAATDYPNGRDLHGGLGRYTDLHDCRWLH